MKTIFIACVLFFALWFVVGQFFGRKTGLTKKRFMQLLFLQWVLLLVAIVALLWFATSEVCPQAGCVGLLYAGAVLGGIFLSVILGLCGTIGLLFAKKLSPFKWF
jgi:hypothetical protein